MTTEKTPKYYFEDFPVGFVADMPGPTVDEQEMLDFARRYDPQSFHADPEAAKHSPFGGLIASGWMTAGLCMRAIYDGYLKDTAGMGSPGVENLLWRTPVRAGDTLRVRMTVMQARVSASKPDRGLITHHWEVFNQRDEQVMEMTGITIARRRPGAK